MSCRARAFPLVQWLTVSRDKRPPFTPVEPPGVSGAKRAAFTLVELLVVITIIVVLLALILPAMGMAIYQATLAKCAANQRMVCVTLIGYATSNGRYYPPRPSVPPQGYDGPFGVVAVSPSAVSVPPLAVRTGYDMRPVIRKQLELNPSTVCQCPLVETIDLEERLPDEYVYGNQALWFGWFYYRVTPIMAKDNDTKLYRAGEPMPGMEKLGDRMEAEEQDTRQVKEYTLLISDTDRQRESPNGSTTSHPDPREKRMVNSVWVRLTAGGIPPHTASLWGDTNGNRGSVDHNFGYADNSVRRVTYIEIRDPRMDRISAHYAAGTGADGDTTLVPPE